MPDAPDTSSMTSPAQRRMDGTIQNAMSGTGVPGVDQAESSQLIGRHFTPAGARREYRDSWAGRREIDRPAGDLIPASKDWALTGLPPSTSSDDVKTYLDSVGSSDYPEDNGVMNILGRLYGTTNMVGGGAGVMLIEDGLPPSEPVDVSRIEDLVSIEILERDEISPYRTRSRGPAEYYIIGSGRTEVEAASIVHASRVIRSAGARLSPRDEWENQGWGDSVLDALFHERRAMLTATQELGSMATKTVQDVVVFAELSEMLCQAGGAASIEERIALMARSRGQHKIIPLDGGKFALGNERGRPPDSYQTAARDARGITDVQQGLAKQWAGGTGQTPSIALGLTPGGLNTGENAGDWQSWGSFIDNERTRWLWPRLRMVLEVVFAARNGPTRGRVPPAGWGATFDPLWRPSPLEDAQLRAENAATDRVYFDLGLPAEVILRERFVEGNEGALELDDGDIPPALEPDPTTTGPAAPTPAKGELAPSEGEEVEEADEEPDELQLAWTDAQPPADAALATDLASELGVTANLVHKVAKDYQVTAYPKIGYPNVPLYSLRDMKQALLDRQNGVPPPTLEVADAAPKKWWQLWRK